MTSSALSWYALRVRSRCEKSAAADLVRRGFPVCAATAPQLRIWCDRSRLVELPLFPGYIFARFEPASRHAVVGAAGVVGIVGFGGVDHNVADIEVEGILALMRSGQTVAPEPFLTVGEMVQVQWGPLTGLRGILQQVRNRSRIILSVDVLQRSVSVEVDGSMVRALRIAPKGQALRRGAA